MMMTIIKMIIIIKIMIIVIIIINVNEEFTGHNSTLGDRIGDFVSEVPISNTRTVYQLYY